MKQLAASPREEKAPLMYSCFPVVALLLLLGGAPLCAQVQISEFMANNTKTLKDDFGQYEDWIELYNYSATNVNLLDWFLTDKADNLSQWRFPATNLPPRAFLVVFASNRDRRSPGLPLHTNFKLDSSGDYLALVDPNGRIATQFSPAYPPQMPDVSYGFGPQSAGHLVLTTNNAGRLLAPANASPGAQWTAVDFNDSSWRLATNGLGFETGQSDDPRTVASAVLADQPVACWRLNETSGAIALNSGWLAATGQGQFLAGVSNGVPGPRPPAFPGFETGSLAARLNGAGARVEVSYSPDLNPAAAFTVEAWAKPSQTRGTPAWIFSSLNVSSGRSGYALAHDYSAQNQWEFRLGDTSGYIATAYGGAVNTNQWQYVAGVYDGATARLYVNGALAASATLARPFVPNAAEKVVIGGRVDNANPYYYAGDLCGVSVIDRALTAAQIAARFQLATNAAPPVNSYNYASLIKTDLRTELLGVNSACYLRLPFVITNAAELDQITLRVKYDDGFAAWINGVPVAAANAPAAPLWNSAATTRHPADAALRFEEFDLSDHLGSVRTGLNVLALQGLNVAATNADFLLLAELEAAGSGDYQAQSRYFINPTPRNPNGLGAKDLGPILTQVGHLPTTPGTNDSIFITCRVTPAFALVTNVVLNWRVMFNPVNQQRMFDDGLHGDGAAGDGVYGAEIPSQTGTNWTYSAGQMVRWFVAATDSLGRSSRWPLFENPASSAEYLGTVVQPDYVASKLPIFHFFAPPTVLQPGPNTQQIGADSEQGGRVSLFFDGEFYDNVYMELRGNTSAGLNKKAHRLEFNREHPFRHPGPGGRILKSSLLAEHLDPAYLRQHLCFWLLDLMGVPSPFDYPIRAQLNGAFYQLAFHTDVLGSEQLERLGYDPSGALYKCAGQVNPQFSSTGGFQKLLPKTNLTDRADYLQLANGINESKSLAVRRASVFDLLDVAEVVNYLAGARFCAENDDVWANMCLYRDTFGDGLWRIIPFDMNASWGQLYGGSSPLQATNDMSKSHPFYGGSQVQENGSSAWNRIYDVIVAVPETRDMLRRRERSLLDGWVFPPGTAAGNLLIENHIKQMTNQVWAEAMLDRAKWGFSPWASGKRFPDAINELLTQYIGPRRRHWYVTHCVTNTAKPLGLGNSYNAGLPQAQPANAVVSFFDWDSNPASGSQEAEYVCLTNANSYAVDLSGWRIEGDIRHTFTPGTVIPASNVLYLSPNVAAFRTRANQPRGGMGLFVQGNYQGHLSAWGGLLTLADATGRSVSTTRFTGAPSLAQQFLRITEIMYHPTSLPGRTNDPQDFEYIKLKNISTNATLNLAGVRLVNGIEFLFPANAAPLAPGQILLLARNTNAFALRYGGAINVAGQYSNSLDNAGEMLRLEDAVGEKILEFAYDPRWYPVTDGLGFSLAIVNEQVPWSAWDQKASWRPSGVLDGSPGEADPQPSVIPPIRVNEVLAHSVPPWVDSIELWNPTDASVNLEGWLLTDDLSRPKKYRIPAGVTMPPGGYLVLTAGQFGAGPDGFRLSRHGERAGLFSADAATNLTGYYHGFEFADSPVGVTFGRYVTSQGQEEFVLQSAITLGTNNAPPRVGPVVISEMMYRPPDASNRTDNVLDEYIELQNTTETRIPLNCVFTNETGYGMAAATNAWRLRNAVDYAFPADAFLPAYGRLLVVGFDPANPAQLAAFRTLYSVPAETMPVFGPWTGKLDNSGETLELVSPGQPEVTVTNVYVPFIMIDKVAYQDAPPWPAGADGQGFSLQRRSLTAYGNDPVNWFAARPSAGQTNLAPPLITLQPRNLVVKAGGNASFAVTVDGAEPLDFQWQFNGAAVASATNAECLIQNVQPIHAGNWAVVVTNAIGSVTSIVAVLTVTVPAPILGPATWDGSQISLSIESWRGLMYVLEYKPDLNESVWTPLLPPTAGTGGVLSLSDTPPPHANRFYRIRCQ